MREGNEVDGGPYQTFVAQVPRKKYASAVIWISEKFEQPGFAASCGEAEEFADLDVGGDGNGV